MSLDLSTLVQPDRNYRLELTHPVTREPLGIVFFVRSDESDEARAVSRRHADKVLASRQQATTATIENELLDKAVACIASWDWGGNLWAGQKVGDFDPKLARDIMASPAGGWIFEQVMGAARDRANFTD